MVLFFATLLGLSIVGMVATLWLKHYELSTGTMVLSGIRPKTQDLSRALFLWVEKVLPALLREKATKLVDMAVALMHLGTAQAVLFFERVLERTLRTVREKTAPERLATGEVSPFLREVADHKRQLLRRSRKSRTLVEK